MDHPPRGLFQAMTALNFIHLQLVELAGDCGKMARSGLASLQFFMELQDKLEKILHETRAACCPPLKAPVMSDFETLQSLGSGAYGTVNLVGHKRTGITFAMKTIRRESVSQNSQAKLFLERDILTFTNSPFVVSFFCSFETTTDFCMVMEKVEGGDCAALLQHYGPLPFDMACLYVAETTLALEYLHSYGIVHRDLKPANMLISSMGHIKLADFGLAAMGPINMTVDLKKEDPGYIVREFAGFEMAGTPLYYAPETIMKTGFGKPVDWWALGIVLYEFLTCAFPFDGDTVSDIFEAVMSADITWPPESNALPADAQHIIHDLLVKDPLYRLGTGGAGDVKAHRFFEGLDWNVLLNIVQSYEASAAHRMYDIFRHVEPPADEPPADEPPADVCITKDNPCLDVSPAEVESPVELLDFCAVAFRFKEVYSSPEHLSLVNLLSDKQRHSTMEQENKEQLDVQLDVVDEGYEGQDSKDLHHGEDQQLLPPNQSSEYSDEAISSQHGNSSQDVSSKDDLEEEQEEKLEQEFERDTLRRRCRRRRTKSGKKRNRKRSGKKRRTGKRSGNKRENRRNRRGQGERT